MGQIAKIFGTPQLLARFALDSADYSTHMIRQIKENPILAIVMAEGLLECVQDPDTRDYLVLTEFVAVFIRRGEPIPHPFRAFAAGAITGKIAPRQRKGRPGSTLQRDFALWVATEIVAEQFVLPKYSNGSATRTTAAEIVAEVAEVPIDAVLHAIRKHKDFAPPILGAINTS
nr:hypothetical protein EC580_08130 [Acidithiobacillus sulfuriphilus]